MGEAKLTYELAIAFGFFDWVEVLALQILNEREAEKLFVAYVSYVGRNCRPPESASRPESALASDELEPPVLARSNGDRLEEPTRLHAHLELLELRIGEVAPRLLGVWDNLIEPYFAEGIG